MAKGPISKRVFQENKARQIFGIMYVCVSGGKKCIFFGKFGVLCFVETPASRFAFLPYYRRNKSYASAKAIKTCLHRAVSF